MSQALPSMFVSHGAPDLLLSERPARRFLQELGARLPRPSAIVIISAHWATPSPTVTTACQLETIHDFHGWQPELYDLSYPAKTSASLVERLTDLMDKAGHGLSANSSRGLDHGAWVPLCLMYPQADIPVVQLSLLGGAAASVHFQIGEALQPLREEGVLVIGSGATVHNLRMLRPEGSQPDDWAVAFDEWLFERLHNRDIAALMDFSSKAQYAHPTPEHLMPLFVAMGAGWSGGQVARIHHSFSLGNLGMASYSFGTTVELQTQQEDRE